MRYACWLVTIVILAGCGTAPSSPAAREQSPVPIAAAGSGGTNRPDQLNKPYVVIVSFDGFRADYLDRYPAPNFQRVARNGVRAESLIPAFPSKSIPNHYTIVTGQYPETHGIVANRFFDPARGKSYALGDVNTVPDASWYRGEPIWVTAERQGMVAGTFVWVGAEVPINGLRATYWKDLSMARSISNPMRVDSVLSWLRKPAPERPHLVTLYMGDVDGAGHEYGPDSPQVAAAILKVDSALGRLIDGVATLEIRDSTYVVVVSDHGMSTYTPATSVALESLIDTAGVRLADSGPNANLHVSGGIARARVIRDAINAKLTHGRAYLRQDVPARLHYRADPRIGDIVVMMDEHYQIMRRAALPRRPGGTHGWDPLLPSMRGIFLVTGPRIRKGATIPPFENVNIYPFLTEVLGLTPAPNIEGKGGWLLEQVTR